LVSYNYYYTSDWLDEWFSIFETVYETMFSGFTTFIRILDLKHLHHQSPLFNKYTIEASMPSHDNEADTSPTVVKRNMSLNLFKPAEVIPATNRVSLAVTAEERKKIEQIAAISTKYMLKPGRICSFYDALA
jgi:hypothetical protein